MKKLDKCFRSIIRVARVKYPRLGEVKLYICPMAEKMHQKKSRFYAHTYHMADRATGLSYICVSKYIEYLPERNIKGIIWHELGHLIAGIDGSEDQANRAIKMIYSVDIKYDMSTVQYI